MAIRVELSDAELRLVGLALLAAGIVLIQLAASALRRRPPRRTLSRTLAVVAATCTLGGLATWAAILLGG